MLRIKIRSSINVINGWRIKTSPAVLSIFTSTFSYVHFCNSSHKTETGTANSWWIDEKNHLYESLWSTNQKHWAAVRSYFTLFSVGAQHCYAFYQPRNYADPQPTYVGFFSSKFTVQDHILSSALEMLLTYYRMRPGKYRWFFWGQNFVILWKLFSKKNIPSQNPCL
jgi:hypothetical protein